MSTVTRNPTTGGGGIITPGCFPINSIPSADCFPTSGYIDGGK